jgi:hypothetical protein
VQTKLGRYNIGENNIHEISEIKRKVTYHIYIVGHDVHVVDIDLPGTMTSYNISRVPLTPGILFYSNVVGYSLSGIHSTETSDGIIVDSVPPTSGTVFDGIGIL